MKALLGKLSLATQWLAAALLVLATGRMAWAAVSDVSLETAKASLPAAAPAAAAASATAGAAAPKPADDEPPLPTGKPIRMMVLVKHRDSRTQVMVNGSYVGNAPYAGDLTCIPGETLTFEIVPPGAASVTRTRRCEGEEITISE